MLMPACLGFAATSVLTRVKIQSEKCAKLDQIFSPLTMKSSPSASARVARLARSDPALGSE